MGKDWPWMIGVTLLAGVALSIAAFALGSGTTTVAMLSVALIALALSQLVSTLRGHLKSSEIGQVLQNQQDIAQTVVSLSNENRRINAENLNLSRNVEQFRHETAGLSSSLQEGIANLRTSHETVAQNLQSILEAQRDIQSSLTANAEREKAQATLEDAIAREQQWTSQQVAQKPLPDYLQPATASVEQAPQAPTLEGSAIAEALTLALEPVVDLYTSSTAHYRMVLGMANDRGDSVPQDVFLKHAERLGLRDQLDVFVIEQALPLLAQLRQRDQAMSLFVPVGAATLATPSAIQRILQHISQSGISGQGLVLDVAHAVLASLPEASLEGLATLARGGVPLSLSQASISGIDLGSLNRLNVRYISLAAASVGVGGTISAGLPGFIQSARALRIQIVISNVGNPAHVQGLARTARFASGPAFAIPRKLKRTEPQASPLAAVA